MYPAHRKLAFAIADHRPTLSPATFFLSFYSYQDDRAIMSKAIRRWGTEQIVFHQLKLPKHLKASGHTDG